MNISAQKLWRLVTSICVALLFLTQDIHSNGLTSFDRLLDITSPKGKELLDKVNKSRLTQIKSFIDHGLRTTSTTYSVESISKAQDQNYYIKNTEVDVNSYKNLTLTDIKESTELLLECIPYENISNKEKLLFHFNHHISISLKERNFLILNVDRSSLRGGEMDINTFCILIAQDKDTHKILLSEISNDRQKMFWVSQKQLFNNLLSEEYIINKDQVSWIIFRPVNSNNSLHSKKY